MTVNDAVKASGLPRPDAEILMALLLGKDRTWVFAHGDDALPDDKTGEWETFVARRKTGEPIAHIVGSKEFFGRMFHVTADTLVPRPATEHLITKTIELLKTKKSTKNMTEIDSEIVMLTDIWGDLETVNTLVDIGTGSGCIAISLSLEVPDMRVIATDISEAALEVATKNAKTLGATVEFRHGDTLYPLTDIDEPFLIISNPPYIPEEILLDKDVADFEPHDALFSGNDGMEMLHRLTAQAKADPKCVGYILECRIEQAKKLLA